MMLGEAIMDELNAAGGKLEKYRDRKWLVRRYDASYLGRFALPELAMERWGMKNVGGDVLMVGFPTLLALVPTDRLPSVYPKLEAASYRRPTWVRHISQSSQVPLPPAVRDAWNLRQRKPAEIDIYDGYGDMLAVLPAGELQSRITARLPNVPDELHGAIVNDILASDWSILRQATADRIIQAVLPEIFGPRDSGKQPAGGDRFQSFGA